MEYILQALQTSFEPYNLLVMVLATAAGLIMGMLPGLSATMAIALLTLQFSLRDSLKGRK